MCKQYDLQFSYKLIMETLTISYISKILSFQKLSVSMHIKQNIKYQMYINTMILLFAFTLLLQSLYACYYGCDQCGSHYKCLKCSPGFGKEYYADNCYSCPSNCDFCIYYLRCTTCSSGYSSSYYGDCNQNNASDSSNASSSGGVIAAVIICPIFGCLCIIFCCCKYLKKSNTIPTTGDTQINVTANNLHQIDSLRRIERVAASIRKWQDNQVGQQFRHWQNCSICLSQQLNVKTQCQHGFHIECLREWFSKKSTCPNCVAEIDNVVLFCNICHSRCLKLSLKSARDMQQLATTCDFCKRRLV